MVMANENADQAAAEQTLSAQSVGREFVRQYYTFMNAEPHHLHRFYSQQSTFVHGGLEKAGEELPPVVGQTAIHQKIMSLNFRDCHTKICQVDSQPTLARGVVVQVSGELSNNGEPMRRFMQTFVLAPQGEKQYFVHNAMFRYQDEVFPEDEDDDSRTLELQPSLVENGASAPVDIHPPVPETTFYEQPATAMSNGSTQEDEPEPAVEEKKEVETVELENEMDSLAMEEEQETYDDSEPAQPEAAVSPEPEPLPQPAEPAKPFTWADMASKNTPNAPAQVVPAFGNQPRPTRAVLESKPDINPVAAPVAPVIMPGTASTQPLPQRATRAPRDVGRSERDRSNTSRDGEGDGEGRRQGGMSTGGVGAKYPDSQQLFVGNLPHTISEAELRVFFSRWGKVNELRINTKSSGGKLPNFGFVVFDSAEAVQAVLRDKPIKFNGEHRLNVEEKKPRNPRSGGPRGNNGGERGGGGPPRGNVGPPRGGGYGSRGGFGGARPTDGDRRNMGMSGGPARSGMAGGPQRR